MFCNASGSDSSTLNGDSIMKKLVTACLFAAIFFCSACPNPAPAQDSTQPLTPPAGPTDMELITQALALVDSTTVMGTIQDLSGARSTTIGGSAYTLSTRNTNSGTPIQMATQYAYEKLVAYGYDAEYHDWNTNYRRNVIARKTGANHPNQAIIVCASIDSMPSSGSAPGADDNASGSAAVLECARVLASLTFDSSIIFILFTGHEQGLYGSAAYVNSLDPGLEIAAVINMTMIGWSSGSQPNKMRLHTRTVAAPQYSKDKAIADLFVSMNQEFQLPIDPIVDADGESASDHASFWNKGIPAILVMQDDTSDFNPYYHTINDTFDRLNVQFLISIIKAVTATTASLADPLHGE